MAILLVSQRFLSFSNILNLGQVDGSVWIRYTFFIGLTLGPAKMIEVIIWLLLHTWNTEALCPSSGILNTRKHNVSEIGSVSVLRLEVGRHLFCWVP
jgi:hypothetical protein